MNVRDLIALLEQYPADMPVIVHSYEAGYDPVTSIRELAVLESPDKAWYVGVYADTEAQGQKMLLIESAFRNEEKP